MQIDTGSEGNLMPSNMFKMLFPRTPITQLNKNINKKVRLCTYYSLNMSQLGTCSDKIKYKDIELPCNFFVAPGNGPALLGMLKCEKLELLSVNCTAIDTSQKKERLTSSLH